MDIWKYIAAATAVVFPGPVEHDDGTIKLLFAVFQFTISLHCSPRKKALYVENE